MQVRLTIHPRRAEQGTSLAEVGPFGSGFLQFIDIRRVQGDCTSTHRHDTEQVRAGKIVVPEFRSVKQRRRMMEIGAYPGVEYRIMRIFDEGENEIFGSQPNCEYEMRPIYPLVDQLERQWPVRVKEQEIPMLLTSNQHNLISAVGSLFTAVFGLASAFAISQAISFFFIPSKSMDPTLQVGDVLLVEKVTPRLLGERAETVGDVVLFSPPKRLRDIVASTGGHITRRDLFVKRIAGHTGDLMLVDRQGKVQINGQPAKENRDLCGAEPLRLIERYIQPGETSVGKNEVFVMGDCSSVSIDSRVWGPLESKDIVGKPIMRIWPLERFGAVPKLTETEWND
jgi:signal peptidase I